MRVETEKRSFEPVTVVLESEDEVRSLLVVLGSLTTKTVRDLYLGEDEVADGTLYTKLLDVAPQLDDDELDCELVVRRYSG